MVRYMASLPKKIQLNLSTTITQGTEESGHCREFLTGVNVCLVGQKSGRWWRFDCTLRTVATFSRCSSLRSMAVLSGARLSEAANTRRARTGSKAETKSSSSSCSRLNLHAVSLPSPALIIQRAISAPNQNRHATQASGIGESLLTCFASLSYAYPYLTTLMN